MIDRLQVALLWVTAHPLLTLVVLFLMCIAESMVVVGMLIPTPLILLPAGALVALGSLPFWTTVLVAMAGAVLGDSINFWAGRRYGQRALESRYAQRYAAAVTRGRMLFEQHGAKALILARFVGLVRPFISATAGMYRMSAARFLGVELFASFLWAAPLIAAGVVFGASLSLAAEVATRLAVLLVALLVALGLLFWLVNSLQHRARDWLSAVLDWSERHRELGRLGRWLADPTQPETPALALTALVLLCLGSLWLWILWGHGVRVPGLFDTMAWQGAQDFRTPVTTALALGVAQLADWRVYTPVAVTVLVALLLLRRTRAAAHWLAAVAFGAALSLGLYWLLKVPDPVNYFRGKLDVRFGGRDLVLATVIYGFLPVLLATERARVAATIYYAGTAAVIALMLAADVYLGAVWLSTGLFSVLFGALWVTVLGIGYRRHDADPLPAREVLPLAFGVLIAATAWESSAELGRQYELPPPETAHRIAPSAWWNGGYAQLPAYRVDAAGIEKQPLSLQWRGALPRIDAALHAAGWQAPVRLSWESSLRWLAVSAPLSQLPILPQVHAGRHQVLMLHRVLGHDEQWVIRLWPSGWTAGSQPVWLGSVTRQTARRALKLLRVPITLRDYDGPLAALADAPPGFEARRVTHPRRDADDDAWSGGLWLVRPRRGAEAQAPDRG